MSRRQLRVLPQDWQGTRSSKGGDCVLAHAMNRQYGGTWVVGPGTADQVGTGRRMRLGADARRAVIQHDLLRVGASRRRPVTVTLYDRGKPGRKATAVKGAAGGGVALMAVSGGLWWVPLLVMSVIAIPVFIALIVNKVSVPRVVRPAAPQSASRARWPDVPGYDPGQRARGTGA